MHPTITIRKYPNGEPVKNGSNEIKNKGKNTWSHKFLHCFLTKYAVDGLRDDAMENWKIKHAVRLLSRSLINDDISIWNKVWVLNIVVQMHFETDRTLDRIHYILPA